MITTLTDTTTDEVSARLLGDESVSGGSRVLTLIIDTDADVLEEALAAAHGASRDHPCRIIAVIADPRENGAAGGGMDAQIRTGGDAGAGETLVLRATGEVAAHTDTLVVPFILPDIPVVAWWPTIPPPVPSSSLLGALAGTRITNTPALADPVGALAALAPGMRHGDIDLAWTRITLWRAMIASVLSPYATSGAIGHITVAGEPGNASLALMVQWLGSRLAVPVGIVDSDGFSGIREITVDGSFGRIIIARLDQERVSITGPDGQGRRVVTMARREPVTTLDEELRRLSPDPVFEEILALFADSHGCPTCFDDAQSEE